MPHTDTHTHGPQNGAAAIAIGVEAGRIRSMALDVPKKTAKVDKAAGKIAGAAGAILDEVKVLGAGAQGGAAGEGAEAPAESQADFDRRVAVEVEMWDRMAIFRVGAARLRTHGGDEVAVVFRCATRLEPQVEDPRPELVVARRGIDLLADVLNSDYAVDDSVLADFAEAVAGLLDEVLDE